MVHDSRAKSTETKSQATSDLCSRQFDHIEHYDQNATDLEPRLVFLKPVLSFPFTLRWGA